jgi:hypothetical protein
VLLASLAAPARAQGTAPPTPDPGAALVEPADEPGEEAASGEGDAQKPKPKLEEVWDAFRGFKSRLPFHLGAGIYLLYYQALDPKSTLANGSYQGVFQVSSFYLKLDKEWQGIGAHMEIRFRDSGHAPGGVNPELRSYFNSNIWPQEIYVYYAPKSFFRVKAGKLYRRTGIFWDDSFFGGLTYYDGITLNPDYGFSIEGDYTHRSRQFGLAYFAQFFVASDGINGGYNVGRTVGDPATSTDATGLRTLRTRSPNPEGERDAANNPTTDVRLVANARLVLKVAPTPKIAIEAAGGVSSGQIDRITPGASDPESPRYVQAEGDVTAWLGPTRFYVEYLRQYGPAVRDATYVLAGARWSWRDKVLVRFNASWVRYALAPDVDEFILQPGITWNIGGGFGAIVEYDEWQRKDPRVDPSFTSYDRSLNLVFSYIY